MNSLQIAQDYIREERDFLTPLSPVERFRRILTPQTALAPQAFPLTWMPCIDISGIGQSKEIAKAFPELFAAGWKLVIMRASIGLTKDALFDYFWRAARDSGMYMMTYHFGYTAYSGMSQASLYLKTIDPMLVEIDGKSAAVLDVESPGEVTAWRKTITDFHGTTKVELTTGDYSSVTKWQSCTGNMVVPGFAWNASWSNIVNVPSFAPAIQTILRQIGVYLKHAWVPKPPGVNEDVDVNYFMGTETELRKFLGYDDTPPPPPPPPPSEIETRLAAVEVGLKNLETRVDTLTSENKRISDELDLLDKRVGDYYAALDSRITKLEQGGIPSNKPAFQIGGSTANCRIISGYNDPDPPATPKPIMAIPPVGPHRIQFKPGVIVLLASNAKVDADGPVDYYRVDPSQYPPGEPDQYLRTTDGVLL